VTWEATQEIFSFVFFVNLASKTQRKQWDSWREPPKSIQIHSNPFKSIERHSDLTNNDLTLLFFCSWFHLLVPDENNKDNDIHHLHLLLNGPACSTASFTAPSGFSCFQNHQDLMGIWTIDKQQLTGSPSPPAADQEYA